MSAKTCGKRAVKIDISCMLSDTTDSLSSFPPKVKHKLPSRPSITAKQKTTREEWLSAGENIIYYSLA